MYIEYVVGMLVIIIDFPSTGLLVAATLLEDCRRWLGALETIANSMEITHRWTHS